MEEIFVYAVQEPKETLEAVEAEIGSKFAQINVQIISMKSSKDHRGHFKHSLVRIEPTNLNRI